MAKPKAAARDTTRVVQTDAYDQLRKDFSERFNAFLAERKIRRPDLQKATKIPRDSLSKYALGRAMPSQENLQKLADYLKVKTTDLIPVVGNPTGENHLRIEEVRPDVYRVSLNRVVSKQTAAIISEALFGDNTHE